MNSTTPRHVNVTLADPMLLSPGGFKTIHVVNGLNRKLDITLERAIRVPEDNCP